MKSFYYLFIFFLCITSCNNARVGDQFTADEISMDAESQDDFDQRMAWWREARFGMFIHWGLYAIPAGEWEGVKTHGEWIRHTAQIPLETYNKFVDQFNPVDYDAEAWARMAKEAGMKYMIITSKHHDGFCLWDSEETDFDIMSTPFKRDILKELAEACRKYDIKLGFYHSIMDWHHPDYIPARTWEKDVDKSNADFDNYIAYMKRQIKELATEYGDITVFWLDGEWEDTWTHEHGKDLYHYIRTISPNALINNRVDKGRGGMAGMTSEGYLGDFGTPEQEIPASGIPGVDWESCMTMNDHWGYNQANDNWKSAEDLIRKLTDIASKGGNYLLNVGPMANGQFPPESIDRLKKIGVWLQNNGRAIYGTSASPFDKMEWGKVTFKDEGEKARLFLHVFDWEAAKKGIILPGVADDPVNINLLNDKKRSFDYSRDQDQINIKLTGDAPDPVNTVLEVVFDKVPNIIPAPKFLSQGSKFIDNTAVKIDLPSEEYTVRYTIDGSRPGIDSETYNSEKGIRIDQSSTIAVRMFKGGLPVSGYAQKQFEKVEPLPDLKMLKAPNPGIAYKYFEGDWNKVPDFSKLKPIKEGVAESIDHTPKQSADSYGLLFRGYILAPEEGIYTFYTESDDGSLLYIDNNLVVDNDGLHGTQLAEGTIALARGYHAIKVAFFEGTGGDQLKVSWALEGEAKKEISALSH